MKTKKNNLNKNTSKSKKIAICLLAYKPTIELIQLYDDLYRKDRYDIYVIVDDNNYDISDFREDFQNIQFIKVSEDTCYRSGYIHLNYMVKKGEPSSWDKGIYYFCEVNKINYKYIWFLEDDVFIPHSTVLQQIDYKYNDENVDLLIKNDELIKNKKVNVPQTQMDEVNKYMNSELKPFLSKSMVCAIRVSNHFIKKIRTYVNKNKTMFFLEFFFPTLARYYGLNVKKIEELQNIIYRRIWMIDDILKEQMSLFHPVKKIQLQKSFRRTLQPNEVYFLSKRVFRRDLMESKDVEFNNMNLLQIIIFKNEFGDILKLIQDTSINDNLMYIEIEKKYRKNIFTYKFNIQSIEEIEALLISLKYKFFAIQTITKEHYIYKKHVNIYFINIPGVIEFVQFESHSAEKLKEGYSELGYNENEVKSMDEVIYESNKIFNTDINMDMTLEITKYDKILKYVKKNKELFKKLLEQQYKIYHDVLKLFGDKVIIYDKLMFVA